MKRIFQRALWIILAGTIAGLVFNVVAPRRIPYIRPPRPSLALADRIELAPSRALWENGDAIFLDARVAKDYLAGHVPGALNLPVETFDKAFRVVRPRLAVEMSLVLYCDGERCDSSLRLLMQLRTLGYTNTHVLVNGWTVWRQAKLPTKATFLESAIEALVAPESSLMFFLMNSTAR